MKKKRVSKCGKRLNSPKTTLKKKSKKVELEEIEVEQNLEENNREVTQ